MFDVNHMYYIWRSIEQRRRVVFILSKNKWKEFSMKARSYLKWLSEVGYRTIVIMLVDSRY